MNEYIYSAWFRNPILNADDQDHEWVAMIVILADSPDLAQAWGDRLAHDRAKRTREPFIRSYLEPPSDYQQCKDFVDAPRIAVGEEKSDAKIGW
jgi:hypothetical protein